MPASTGAIGIGVLLKMGNGASPEVYTTVANVVSIDGPEENLETVESTHLASDNFTREYLAGLIGAGSVSGTLHFDPRHPTHDDATGLRSKVRSRAQTSFRIDMSAVFTGSGDKVVTFEGFVTRLGQAVAIDSIIECQFEIQVTGQPVWSAS